MIYDGRKMANKVWQKVLCICGEQLRRDKGLHVHICGYENGREHGLHVSHSSMGTDICFSENRNSDSLVVYFGQSHDFEMAGGVPTEKVWENRVFFRPDEMDKAAKAIAAWLVHGTPIYFEERA